MMVEAVQWWKKAVMPSVLIFHSFAIFVFCKFKEKRFLQFNAIFGITAVFS